MCGEFFLEDSIDYLLCNMIMWVVGVMDELDVDEWIMKVEDGDMFFLCSDGFSNEVGEGEICSVLVFGDC